LLILPIYLALIIVEDIVRSPSGQAVECQIVSHSAQEKNPVLILILNSRET
jgi:hypothetical protein